MSTGLPATSSPRPRRWPHRGPGRRLAALAVLPALMTLGNLLCGFAAIHYAAKPVAESAIYGWSTLTVAGGLIFVGMFLDALDGSVARLTRSTSDLGAQLDSMADMVTFGVAPAFMMLRLVSHYYGPEHYTGILGPDADNLYARMTWTIAAVYICCTALRLARFNVETPSASAEDHRWFRGLPSPGAGGCVASLILLHQHLLVRRFGGEFPPGFEKGSSLLIPLVTLLAAVGMVSTMRYPHLVNRWLGGRKDFASLVRIVIPIVMAIWWLQVALALCFVAYAVTGPVGALTRATRRGRMQTARPPAG
ncbi:MAG: putative CDP-diacylglycerol--serine O-phosphatidyltransferase [Planctomycetota bacterium]|jgi:CDP-diacylglycerol--serine O-phosphatidyltransferase